MTPEEVAEMVERHQREEAAARDHKERAEMERRNCMEEARARRQPGDIGYGPE